MCSHGLAKAMRVRVSWRAPACPDAKLRRFRSIHKRLSLPFPLQPYMMRVRVYVMIIDVRMWTRTACMRHVCVRLHN